MSESSKVRLPNKVEAIIPIVFLLTVMITKLCFRLGT